MKLMLRFFSGYYHVRELKYVIAKYCSSVESSEIQDSRARATWTAVLAPDLHFGAS